MKRRALGATCSLLGLAVLFGCNRGPVVPAPPKAALTDSRAAEDGDCPKTSAIVAREGDHLYVVVDVEPRDAKGRKVTIDGVDLDPPSAASKPSPPPALSNPLTLELRVPATTRGLKLSGTSEGGATWSKAISTTLEAR